MILFILITGIGAFLVKKFMNPSKLKNVLFWTLTGLASFIPIVFVISFIVGFFMGIYQRIF